VSNAVCFKTHTRGIYRCCWYMNPSIYLEYAE
jgi:hypothetical protein